ncbi:MAG TPA: SipW-dependent-type signal peptide-containing protein [Clostridia bacterium]|nr:SipW-dependent-type signal peptide-containing protein [Clostridia bacterium]
MTRKHKTLLLSMAAVVLLAIGVMGTFAYLTSQSETVTNTFTVGRVSFSKDQYQKTKGLNETEVDQYGIPKYRYSDGLFLINKADGLLDAGATPITVDGKNVYIDSEGNFVDRYHNPLTVEGITTIENYAQENGGEALRVTANEYKLLPGKKYLKDPKAFIERGSEPAYVFVELTNPLESIEANEAASTIQAQVESNGWIQISKEAEKSLWRHKDIVDASESEIELAIFESFTVDKQAQIDIAPGDIVVKAFAIQADGLSPENALEQVNFAH